MRRLPLKRAVILSAEDFEEITEHGRWTSASGELTAVSFQGLIMSQMRRYARRKVVEAMTKDLTDTDYDQMFTLKMILATVDQMQTGDKHPHVSH